MNADKHFLRLSAFIGGLLSLPSTSGQFIPGLNTRSSRPLAKSRTPRGTPLARHSRTGGLPMAQKERIREALSGLPTLEHLVERVEAGWKLVAIEWECEAAGAPLATDQFD